MDELEFYIDVPESDIMVENRVGAAGYYYRIWFRDKEAVDRARKLMEDLKIFITYHDR